MVTLDDFLAQARYTNEWVTYDIKSGGALVYVRRNAFNRTVLEIANIVTAWGYGAAWQLYRSKLAAYPCIAENILCPKLDTLLAKWGWTSVYTDLGDVPTRTNPKFDTLFGVGNPRHNPRLLLRGLIDGTGVQDVLRGQQTGAS